MGGLASFVCIVTTTFTFAFYSLTTNLKNSVDTVLPAYRVEFLFKPAFPNFKNSGRVISPSEIPVPGFRPSTNSIPLLGQKPCINHAFVEIPA